MCDSRKRYLRIMKIYHVFHIFVVLLSGFLLSSPCLWAQRIPKKGLSSISKKAYAVKKLNSSTGQPLQNQLLASVRKNLQQQKQTEQLITSRINGYRDLVIEMQKHMIAAPAVSPHHGGEGEDAKVQYLMKVLKTLPFDELYVIPVKDPKAKTGVRPNIIAKYYGKNTHKNMWVMAHTDVVSPGNYLPGKQTLLPLL